VNWLLRFEGACYAAAAVYVYGHIGFSWIWFFVFFLAPDLSMLGYLKSPRVGARCYNFVHATPLAWAILGIAYFTSNLDAMKVALILFAHIGIDRALGYGLKYADDFKHTHLGWIGRSPPGH
jgi:hypothetical protein